MSQKIVITDEHLASTGIAAWAKPRNIKPRFNSTRLVMSVLRHVLKSEVEYHVSEMILLVNESKAGAILHPPFAGKNAQRLLDKLVKNGKITMVRVGYYTLPQPRKE